MTNQNINYRKRRIKKNIIYLNIFKKYIPNILSNDFKQYVIKRNIIYSLDYFIKTINIS